MANVVPGVEPRGPTLDQLLLQCLAHLRPLLGTEGRPIRPRPRKPLFERVRAQGSDFLDKNVALAEEVRRTFADIDRIDSELKKAAKAIQSASGLVVKYRGKLQGLCEIAPARKMPPTSERSAGRRSH